MAYDLDDMVNELRIGYPSIDEIHEEILVEIDIVCDFVKSNKSKREVLGSLTLLENRINKHFKIEETIMKKRKYSKYVLHKSEHKVFKKKFETFKGFIIDCDSEVEGKRVNEMKALLLDWKIKHIKTTDRELGEFIRSVASANKGGADKKK